MKSVQEFHATYALLNILWDIWLNFYLSINLKIIWTVLTFSTAVGELYPPTSTADRIAAEK